MSQAEDSGGNKAPKQYVSLVIFAYQYPISTLIDGPAACTICGAEAVMLCDDLSGKRKPAMFCLAHAPEQFKPLLG